ncbi:MAG: 30S ribosomal protein S2 [Phycisphaerales bacterium]|nr:30S ribosomal protein S2 [Phycisphaerales bacterium]
MQQDLLEAGVHFGHLRKKCNPKMQPYIYAEKKGIHIIDLNKTEELLNIAGRQMQQIVKSGKNIMFVATKKQAKNIVAEYAKKMEMPYVTERWLGGFLTNFNTVRKSIKKMLNIEKMLADGSADSLTKKERLTLMRDKDKMAKVLGGIAHLNKLPTAIFLVDIGHEHIALAEAKKLGITTFGIVDTNCDPTKVDYVIPANDDASKSINIITSYIANFVMEGMVERKKHKEEVTQQEEEVDITDEKEKNLKLIEAELAGESLKTRKGSKESNAPTSKRGNMRN